VNLNCDRALASCQRDDRRAFWRGRGIVKTRANASAGPDAHGEAGPCGPARGGQPAGSGEDLRCAPRSGTRGRGTGKATAQRGRGVLLSGIGRGGRRLWPELGRAEVGSRSRQWWRGTEAAWQASTGARICKLFARSRQGPCKREYLRRPETPGVARFSALFTGDERGAGRCVCRGRRGRGRGRGRGDPGELDAILTVVRLGLPKELRRSLACTNIISSPSWAWSAASAATSSAGATPP
jgi:hypothetical protein